MIEEMQMIADMVGNLGGDAKEAFVIYLVYLGGKFIINTLLAGCVVLAIYKTLKAIIFKLSIVAELKQAAGLSSGVELTYSERQKLITLVQKGHDS